MFRRGKYGLRAARRDLASLLPDERSGAADWYELAENRMHTFGAPSNISYLIALRTLAFGLGFDMEGPTIAPGLIAINMGYAARMVDVERRADLTKWSEAEVGDLVAGDERGRIDAEAVNDGGPRAENIAAWVLGRTDDLEAFFSTASCTPGLWDGLTSWGAMQLHKNMQRKHSGNIRDLDANMIGWLMRLGYILRCLDEGLGEEPGDPTTYSS